MVKKYILGIILILCFLCPFSVKAKTKNYVTSLSVTKKVSIENGKQSSIKVNVKGKGKVNKNVTVTVKNKKIAKVSYNSSKKTISITGKKVGTTTITVTTKAKNKKGKKINKYIHVTIKKTTNSEQQETEPQKSEEVNPVDYYGDGWYIQGNTLSISKIYYVLENVTQTYHYRYIRPWYTYREQITNVVIDGEMINQTGDTIETLNINTDKTVISSGGQLFSGFGSIKHIDIKKLNMDMILNISNMFSYMKELTDIDVGGLITTGVLDASALFAGDTALTEIENLNQLDTSTFITIASMFEGCSNLSHVAVSSWNTQYVKDFSKVFQNCSSLESIDLSNWHIKDANVIGMFWNCNALNQVTIPNVIMKNATAANAMFDKNNSITSYSFAEKWEVDTENRISLINDDCYTAIPTIGIDTNTGKTVIIVYIYYNKTMPKWYKEYVEYMQGVDEFVNIFPSEMLDIYVNDSEEIQEDLENPMPKMPSVSDILKMVIEKLKERNDDTSQKAANVLETIINKYKEFENLKNASEIIKKYSDNN